MRISLNKDEELLDIGVRAFLFEMDILNILKQLTEISKLKSILFNPFQKTLFDSIPKPLIHHNFDISPKNEINQSELREFIQKNKESAEAANNIQQRLVDSLQFI